MTPIVSIDAAAFRRLGALFQELCDASPEVQRTRLAAIDDPDVAAQLARMLEVDRRTTRALQTGGGDGARRVLALDLAREALPERIGPFAIEGLLGAGGMGVVYEAWQAHPRRRLALKVLHGHLVSDEARALFRFEAQALANLRHPGVPQVYDAGEDEGRPWMAMELVRGQPLDVFAVTARLGVRERLALAVEVARAVHHAHEAGVLHRDLKPSNVLVTAEGIPKILDFGIATPLLESRAEGRFFGTPAWASPEQLRGEPVDVTTDVYALATLAHQLVAGQLPYSVDDLPPAVAARAKEATAPPLVGRDVPSDAAWWVGRALAPVASARPPTAEAFADGLARALADLPLPGRGGVAYRLRCFGRRHRRGLAAGGLVVAVGIAAVAGRLAWDGALARQREAATERHRVALDRSLDALAAEGRWDEVEALFTAFVTLPEHEGTAALSRALTGHGLRRARGGRPGDVTALADGWLDAPDAQSLQAAGEALVGHLLDRARYDEAGAVARQLDPTDAVRDALARSAVAAGDVAGGVALGAEPRGVLGRLGRAVPAGAPGGRGRLLDLDGDGRAEVVSVSAPGVVTVARPGAPERRLLLPPGTELAPVVLARDGTLYAVVRCCDSFHGTPRVLVAGPDDGSFTELAALPPARPAAAALLADELYVGTTYPTRGLWSVDLGTGEVRRPDADLVARGTDVTALLAADLTGDGVEELVVGTGDDLRVSAPEGDGLALRARIPSGWVQGLAPGSPGEVLVAADALAVATLSGGVLTAGPPRPVRHARPGAPCAVPLRVDLDGDGVPEVVHSCRSEAGQDRLHVLAPDPADDQVLLDLWAWDAADVDGDGLPELLVGSASGLWLVGVGPDTRVRPPPVRPALDRPVGADASAGSAWRRAGRLLDVGLGEQAADVLATVAPLLDDPLPRATTHVAAARISEHLGDRPAATREWVAAAAGGLPPEGAREARGRARDGLEAELRLEEARALDDDGSLAWVDGLHPVAILASPTLEPAITVHRPEALSRRDGWWTVTAYNDDGLLLSLPVEVTAEAVGLELEVRVRSAELASGLAAQLVDAEGRVLLGAGVDAWGYGDVVHRRTRGHVDGDVTLGDHPEDDPFHTVRTFWLPGRGRGAVDGRGASYWYDAGPVPPPGRYLLRLVAHGDLEYAPALGLEVELRALRLYGLRPADVVAAPPAPSAVADALGAGDPDALRRSVAALLGDGGRAAVRRWLRRDPTWVAPAVVAELGPAAGALLAEAWATPFSHYPDRPDIRAAATSPAFDGLVVADDATAELALARGRVLLRAGHADHAARVLRSALPVAAVASEAHAALALALEATDPVGARWHHDEARRLAEERP